MVIRDTCAMLESAVRNQKADEQLSEFIVRVLLLLLSICLLESIVTASRIRIIIGYVGTRMKVYAHCIIVTTSNLFPGEDDLVDVVGYLHTLDKSQLSHLGTVLGLSRHHVKGMKDSDSFLEDIISLWLQQAGNVKTRSGVPTWRRLVEALRHKLLGQNGIASQIAIQINFKIILQS